MQGAWKTLESLRLGGKAEEVATAFSVEELHNAISAAACFSDEPQCTPTQAVECARMLMGQFRVRDLVDPEIFAASLSTVLQAYPRRLARLAVDPLVGIPAGATFPPAVGEVKTWLDREQGRLGYYLKRAQDVLAAKTPA